MPQNLFSQFLCLPQSLSQAARFGFLFISQDIRDTGMTVRDRNPGNKRSIGNTENAGPGKPHFQRAEELDGDVEKLEEANIQLEEHLVLLKVSTHLAPTQLDQH